MWAIPIVSVMIGSALPLMLPIVASSPVVPPIGLLLFLCWQFLRAEMWPVWIGLPLGLWDDLFSGQPIGCAVGLWTLASIAIQFFAHRIYWRSFRHDWLVAVLLIATAQSLGALIAHRGVSPEHVLWLVLPQILISALLIPLAMRLTAKIDRFRLRPS